MGVYDTLICEASLPDDFDPEGEVEFQTKDLEQAFQTYRITADGRLLWHKTMLRSVPPEQRPYWGTSEWEQSPLYPLIGSLEEISQGWQVLEEFTGTIRFYWTNLSAVGPEGMKTRDGRPACRREYRAHFQNGKLDALTGGSELLEPESFPEAERRDSR